MNTNETQIGITPVLGEPTRFWVASESQPGVVHLVDLDDDGQPGCSCHDFMCRGRACKHIKQVQAEIQKTRNGNLCL